MIKDSLHQNYCQKEKDLQSWYCAKTKELSYPIYSSYDIRDSGFKVSNVDANIYPAGFNNICPVDKESSGDLFGNYIKDHYGSAVKKVMLVTEEHTNNPFYWENVIAIKKLLEAGGQQVLVSFPKDLPEPLMLKSATGNEIQVVSGYENSALVREFKPDLIISNNDFSDPNEDWAKQLSIPMNPPRELGWYQRKKSRYFKHYNDLAAEFTGILGLDPFLLNVETEVFEHFDMGEEASLKELSGKVDAMIARLQKQYDQRGITEKPFVFVKNNAGTYGLAVIRVGSGAEVMDWNYKSRKKMKAAKGGRDVEEVIIQEGIPSRVQAEGVTAEPVIYMIGCELAGGFLRTHAEKSSSESLNSPGAVYKRLCVSDLNVSLQGHPLENVYGWSARLGVLAIGLEAREMGITFKDYKASACV
ncbi:MAG: glutamate--cysteine ligase [Bdellovibrionaceae bacterium]|nr:glutamate--cysteine ligase [Pseudobdellovibrionaceae bacterium]